MNTDFNMHCPEKEGLRLLQLAICFLLFCKFSSISGRTSYPSRRVGITENPRQALRKKKKRKKKSFSETLMRYNHHFKVNTPES